MYINKVLVFATLAVVLYNICNAATLTTNIDYQNTYNKQTSTKQVSSFNVIQYLNNLIVLL